MHSVTLSGLAGITYNDAGTHTIIGSNSSVAETYNLQGESTIDGNGGTDMVNLLASADLSGKLQDIEALNLGANNATITSSDDNSFALSGTGNLSIDTTGTYSAVGITGKGVTINGSIGNDTLTATSNDDKIFGNGGIDTVDAGNGNDKFVLDFSNLTALDSFNGNGGSDTVSLTGSNASVLNDSTAFSNIETLDISSLGLDIGGLTISASSLYSFDSNTTSFSDALTLNVDTPTQLGHISLNNVLSVNGDSSGVTGGTWALSSAGDYAITTTDSHTLYMHVV